jgi:hypothetical protein
MRAVLAYLIITLSILPASTAPKFLPDNWQAYVKTESGHIICFDISDIEYTENGTVLFWLMTTKGEVIYDKGQYEVDCSKNMFTFHSRIFLHKGVDLMDGEKLREPERIGIRSSSSIEIIRERVCTMNIFEDNPDSKEAVFFEELPK